MTNQAFGDAIHAALPGRSITSRRHPLAFAAYTMTLMMGLIFATHWLSIGAVPIFQKLPQFWIDAWIIELLSGGAAGVAALVIPARVSPKWPDLADLLHIEAIAAFVASLGILTYLTAAITLLGVDRVGPSGTILAGLVIGLFARSYQALTDARKVEQYGRVVDAVVALAPEQLTGLTDPKES